MNRFFVDFSETFKKRSLRSRKIRNLNINCKGWNRLQINQHISCSKHLGRSKAVGWQPHPLEGKLKKVQEVLTSSNRWELLEIPKGQNRCHLSLARNVEGWFWQSQELIVRPSSNLILWHQHLTWGSDNRVKLIVRKDCMANDTKRFGYSLLASQLLSSTNCFKYSWKTKKVSLQLFSVKQTLVFQCSVNKKKPYHHWKWITFTHSSCFETVNRQNSVITKHLVMFDDVEASSTFMFDILARFTIVFLLISSDSNNEFCLEGSFSCSVREYLFFNLLRLFFV